MNEKIRQVSIHQFRCLEKAMVLGDSYEYSIYYIKMFLPRKNFFITLRNIFLKEADGILKVLLPKAGDTNQFIRSDVEVAMNNLVENMQPMKAMNAIIIAGVK